MLVVKMQTNLNTAVENLLAHNKTDMLDNTTEALR